MGFDIPLPDKSVVITPIFPRDDCPYTSPQIGCGRGLLTEHYASPPAPPYEGGAFVMSLIPIGQLGSYVFLEDDPAYLYAVAGVVNDEEAVVNARLFRDEGTRRGLL